MPRIAAIATTRAAIMAVSPLLLARGFRKTWQDRCSLDTLFEKQLSSDVKQVISLTFKDGPIAAKHIVWMTGAMGLASEELLGRYRRLTGSGAEGYCPVSVDFGNLHQEYGEGGWKFELPDIDAAVRSFRTVFDEEVDPLARLLDSAEKQASLLLGGPYRHAYWNPAFFRPIALLLLGRNSEAAQSVRDTFGPASSEFRAANAGFVEGVLRDAL